MKRVKKIKLTKARLKDITAKATLALENQLLYGMFPEDAIDLAEVMFKQREALNKIAFEVLSLNAYEDARGIAFMALALIEDE